MEHLLALIKYQSKWSSENFGVTSLVRNTNFKLVTFTFSYEQEESASKAAPLSAGAAKDLMVWSSDSPVMLREGFGIWATHQEQDLAWLQKVSMAMLCLGPKQHVLGSFTSKPAGYKMQA